MGDDAFTIDRDGLRVALDALADPGDRQSVSDLGARMPEEGLGEAKALKALAPIVIGGASRLASPTACAHMDPPTPWVTWATALWNAALNQNLLHPDVSPAARPIECLVIDWIAPFLGMDGGHMTPGSTVANLTALWAARELRPISEVIASEAAHLSIRKAAHLLGLELIEVKADRSGRLDPKKLPKDLSSTALVLTAGTTAAGGIDDLRLAGRSAWTHVDAAWAGPLAFSDKHRHRIGGIEQADSIAVSAHKWLFQPKEAGLIMFRRAKEAHEAVSFGGSYLAAPNVGLLGSHGAAAVPLLATLLSWGRQGLEERIDRMMDVADQLWHRLNADPRTELFGANQSGVILWRPKGKASSQEIIEQLPDGAASSVVLNGKSWVRHVAANPNVDINALWSKVENALRDLDR